jgi:hypothetical protein
LFIFFLRNVYSNHLPFFNHIICWLLFGFWVIWVPCIFQILIPCLIDSLQIFLSHFVGCLFTLVTFSFVVQKRFCLIYLSVSIFVPVLLRLCP